MSDDQMVGQLFLLGLAGNQLGPDEIHAIQAEHVGSVWFVEQSNVGVAGIRAVTDAVQAQVSATSTAKVRFFVAANQEGGIVQALHGPGFSEIPSAIVQGTFAVQTLQDDAATWGTQLLAAGVNLDFAPVMDVVPPGADAQNQPIGALNREYGHDPTTAGSHGTAFLRGLHQAGIDATIKHFPGLGRVQGNTDVTAGVVDTITSANDQFLQSFAQPIAAGADMVMVALATFTQIDPNHLAAFSPTVMRLLRGTYGFTGVIVSDDLGATAAVADIPPATRANNFLEAGGDLIISKTATAADAMIAGLRARIRADATFRARVMESARRVLAVKARWGLLRCGAS
ncbi:MAG TPA: glycoside hydrolase family 3 N-terminal domain-containing protein [Candidatus Limnocylindria bacterium]|nr:glycoside hydrolase family 3 N-terminal domain-containing protein [Candidatus Limnocylindria bacterium]